MTKEELRKIKDILIRECPARREFIDAKGTFYCETKYQYRCKSYDCYFREKAECPQDCSQSRTKSIVCDGENCNRIKKLIKEVKEI